MRILTVILLVVLLMSSCSKEKTVSKKLDGTWELVHMKFYDQESIMYLPTCSGEFIINAASETEISYSMNSTFTLNGTTKTESATGSIALLEKASKLELTVNTVDTSYVEQQTLLVLTKTDLRLEFFDLNGDKRVYTFAKK